MKKLFLLVATLFSLSTTAFAIDQEEDNGFGLKLTVGICGEKFGNMEYDTDVEINGQKIEGDNKDFEIPGYERKNIPLFGLSMDNRWYVAQPGKFGIGITARWLDFAIGKSTLSLNDQELLKSTTVKADFLMPGIVGTFYMNDDMAIDLFYNVGPSLGFEKNKFANDDLQTAAKNLATMLNKDIDDTDAEFGASHYIGAAFRYKIFQAGVEYNYAKLKSMDWFEADDDDEDGSGMLGNMLGDIVTRTNRSNIRIFVGFKF